MKRRVPLLFLMLMAMSYTPQFCFKIHDFALGYEVALAQAPKTVELTILLRDADGRHLPEVLLDLDYWGLIPTRAALSS